MAAPSVVHVRMVPHIVRRLSGSLKPAPAAAGAVRAHMCPLARAPSRVRGGARAGRGGRARLKAAVLKTARVESPREFESPPSALCWFEMTRSPCRSQSDSPMERWGRAAIGGGLLGLAVGALLGCGPELHALEQSLRPFHPVPNENERYELQGVSVLPPQGPWRFALARGNESGSWLDPADGDHVARKHANLLKFARMASTDYRRAGAFILIRRPSIVGADMVALHARVEQGVRAEIRDRLQYERAE